MLSTLRHGSFRWLFTGQVASAFGNFAFIVSVAALLVEAGKGAGTIGAVLALSVVGAVVGSRIRPRLPGVIALLALIPFCVALAALAVEPSLALVIAALVLAGVGETIFDILWMTSLQRDVPDRLLSRVVSLDFLGSLALLPIGLALTGPAVGEFGREAVLLFGAGLALVLLAPPLFSNQVRRFSSAPRSRSD